MKALFDIDKKDYDPQWEVYSRPSVRGIVIREGKLAMIYSQKYNYYKFPGGGVEANETHTDTLIREMDEETGLQVIPATIQPFGYVHRLEGRSTREIFDQYNYYYLCDVEEAVKAPRLEPKELEEGFILEFVAPHHAIEVNRHGSHGGKTSVSLEREARVVECLLQEGYL